MYVLEYRQRPPCHCKVRKPPLCACRCSWRFPFSWCWSSPWRWVQQVYGICLESTFRQHAGGPGICLCWLH